MRKKSIVLVISGLMAISLILASCRQTGTTPATTTSSTPGISTTSAATTPSPVSQVTTSSAETPKYGGTVTFIATEPMGFDPFYNLSVEIKHEMYGVDELLGEDWTLGMSGKGTFDQLFGFIGRIDVETGEIAESWEMPDDTTIIFHIRHGCHFWNKAPVNGREVTADDVVWNINRQWAAPTGYMRVNFATNQFLISCKALDKWTVEVKMPKGSQGLHLLCDGEQVHISAHEVVDTYGDARDWHRVVGVGPWMLTDYVAASSITFNKDPNYWKTDPLHPENRLPYADVAKGLFLVDRATFLSALRTGKIDVSAGAAATFPLLKDDFQSLLKNCPQLRSQKVAAAGYGLWGRIDKKDLPFKDIKVRKALNMAINRQEIISGYYAGEGYVVSPLWPESSSYADYSVKLDELPAEAQEVFSYNPAKAKQLLAEAGYPNGFQTEIVCQASDADYVSIYKDYFSKINVEMKIRTVESTIYRSIYRARSHDQMIFKSTVMVGFPFKMHEIRSESFDDPSYYENEYTRKLYDEAQTYVARDDKALANLLKTKFTPFFYQEAIGVYTPGYYTYRVWWPWVQNYHGESTLGYDNQNCYIHYLWIDQNLKKTMGF